MTNTTDKLKVIVRNLYRGLICSLGLFSITFSISSEVLSFITSGGPGISFIKQCFYGIYSDVTDNEITNSLYILEKSPSDSMYIYSIEEPEDEKTFYKGNDIIPMDLSQNPKGTTLFKNETSYDIKSVLESLNEGYSPENTKPHVLILHTHASEAYYNGDSALSRSENSDENIVAIGKTIAKILNENGAYAIHCTTLHDIESYNDAYSNSLASIKAYLEAEPKIDYIFDIHRDSIVRSDGTIIKPITGKYAQIMILCGTNEKGSNFDNWAYNLSFACCLQDKLNNSVENIARPILVRGASYNQQYAKHSLLIEIGAFGNSMEEANNSAEVLADAMLQCMGLKE